jgi:serine/threonine-protein kinase ATR
MFLAKSAPPGNPIQKKTNILGAFLEHHILGLVARLSEVVNDARDGKPIREKKRCIKAIEEMVKLGKTSTRTARPHVCQCTNISLYGF